MKSTESKKDEMRAEYDFSKAERGKFYRPLDKGYKVHVQKSDGTVIVNHYTLAEGTVLSAPMYANTFQIHRLSMKPCVHSSN
jgi:hypothetical protein